MVFTFFPNTFNKRPDVLGAPDSRAWADFYRSGMSCVGRFLQVWDNVRLRSLSTMRSC